MAQRISRTKKLLVIAAVGALSLGGAGAAFAYWTSTGTGDGTATTAEAVEFVITQGETGGVLAPGSAGQTVSFTVTNPGPGTLYLGRVTVTIADEDGVAWVPAGTCLLTDYSVTMSTTPAYGELDATEFASGVVTVTLANTAVNQDDCQGQTVPLHFVADSTIDT